MDEEYIIFLDSLLFCFMYLPHFLHVCLINIQANNPSYFEIIIHGISQFIKEESEIKDTLNLCN